LSIALPRFSREAQIAEERSDGGGVCYAGEGCFDHAQLRVDVVKFFRGPRRELGGAPLPYLRVPEWARAGLGADGITRDT
jgi:hypothetical protein